MRYFAEAAGTFALVLIGPGAVVVNAHFDNALGQYADLGIGIAFGVIVAAMIFTFGKTSGAHINPAVSIAFYFAGQLTGKRTVGYIIAQIVGGIAASALLAISFPNDTTSLGGTLPHVGIAGSFAIEVVITTMLMLVIFRASSQPNAPSWLVPLAVGGAVGILAFTAGRWTGASMNPARSIGPAVVSGNVAALWLYLVAPCIGSLLAIPLCRCMRKTTCTCRPNMVCE